MAHFINIHLLFNLFQEATTVGIDINKPKDVVADKNGNQVAVKCNESTGSGSNSTPVKANTVPKNSLVLRKVQFMKRPGSKALGFSIVGKG